MNTDLLKEVIETINEMLDKYDGFDGRDTYWKCSFCGMRARQRSGMNTKHEAIRHQDCKGLSLLVRLNRVLTHNT